MARRRVVHPRATVHGTASCRLFRGSLFAPRTLTTAMCCRPDMAWSRSTNSHAWPCGRRLCLGKLAGQAAHARGVVASAHADMNSCWPACSTQMLDRSQMDVVACVHAQHVRSNGCRPAALHGGLCFECGRPRGAQAGGCPLLVVGGQIIWLSAHFSCTGCALFGVSREM